MDLMELTSVLEDHINEGDAAFMEAYMKGRFSFYGIKSAQRRRITKELIQSSKKLRIDDLIALVDQLWGYDEREYQMIGVDVLIANKKKFKGDHILNVERWIASKSWWDTVDMIVTHVVGQIGIVDIKSLEPYLNRWIEVDNIWLNRTCLIFQLKYRNDMDLDRLFDYILRVNHKKEFFVQKAIGWSLRQAGRFYPTEIRSFIADHSLSGLAIREGMKYIR